MSWYAWATGAEEEAAAVPSAADEGGPEAAKAKAEEPQDRGRPQAGKSAASASGASASSPLQLRRQQRVDLAPGRGELSGRQFCERVLVRVYDLGTTVLTHPHNAITKSYGAFHTGVEVFGREWSFGMTDDWRTGITWCPPGKNPDHTFRETLAMGYTKCSLGEFSRILSEMKLDWRGSSYHLLARNCHHFSDALCRKLGVGRLPPWINDLAGVGEATANGIDTVYRSLSLTDAFFSVKSGLYLTIAGIPQCFSGGRYKDLPDGQELEDDPSGAKERSSELHRRPPSVGDLVHPEKGEALVVYHTMSSPLPDTAPLASDGGR